MQEEFALGLGEVHRARAAEKVRRLPGAGPRRSGGTVVHACTCTQGEHGMLLPSCGVSCMPPLSQQSAVDVHDSTHTAYQVKEGTKEVAHKTGEALSSAATAVGHQVGADGRMGTGRPVLKGCTAVCGRQLRRPAM